MPEPTITIPLREAPRFIADSIAAVLRSHGFVVAAPVPDAGGVAHYIDVDRFQQLLREMGNNAAMALVGLHYEHEDASEPLASPHSIAENAPCRGCRTVNDPSSLMHGEFKIQPGCPRHATPAPDACATCGHDRVFHQIGTGNGVPVGAEFCDDRHDDPCSCKRFVRSRGERKERP